MTKGAKLLKIYRVTNDLTQKDFSQKYNVNRSTIASIESGNNQPNLATAQVIASIIHLEGRFYFAEQE